MISALQTLPATSNLALIGPYELTLQEFHNLPVSPEKLAVRKSIYEIEACINDMGDMGYDIIRPDTLTPVHRFINGLYARELTMPAGTLIVGKRHARMHKVIMTKGRCTVYTERGQEELTAPCSFMSPAGEKRVLIIHEETTWTCVHPTNETDLVEVERDLILTEDAHDQLNMPKPKECLWYGQQQELQWQEPCTVE